MILIRKLLFRASSEDINSSIERKIKEIARMLMHALHDHFKLVTVFHQHIRRNERALQFVHDLDVCFIADARLDLGLVHRAFRRKIQTTTQLSIFRLLLNRLAVDDIISFVYDASFKNWLHLQIVPQCSALPGSPLAAAFEGCGVNVDA